MKLKKELLEKLSREMMLTPEEIALRKEFLEFTDADVQLLRNFHEHVEMVHDEEIFAALFYLHLRSFPELREFIPDEATTLRLKAIQAEYFLRLTSGDYGEDYVLDRIRVGYSHQKIGLDPKWYTGAYRKYLSFLLSSLCESGQCHEDIIATYNALLKIVFFDMELALDTYFHGAQENLLHMANHDGLTGLPNGTLLKDRLEQAIHHAHRMNEHVAVLFVDLDRFKNVNDSLGHHCGDKLLSSVADRFLGALREGDTVARLGGDEFVVVLSGIEQEESVTLIAEKLMRSLDQPVAADEHELFVSASVGIAIYPMDGESGDELLKNADTAMYRAKQEGRHCFRFYQQEMNLSSLGRLKLETGLRHAMEKREFVLHYQPLVDVSSGHIVGAEALIRWQSDEGMISPDQFIPLAEETGLIIPIGEWALETACRQTVAWHQAGVEPTFRVAVNLSAHQFRGQDLAGTVARILEETGCKADWLELEITESIIMEQPEAATATFRRLSGMGVTIAIDDFGTGYSSLAYLKRFPIHRLKVDRSFVTGIVDDHHDASIVRAVIALAHSLKLQVTGEGIENRAQLTYLLNLGCDFAQGHLISMPLAANEITPILLKNSSLTPSGRWLEEMTCDETEAHRDCRVLKIGQQAVCLSVEANCGFVNPQGNICEHPLADQLNDAEVDY